MSHKMIHYKGYFLLSLVFVFTGVILHVLNMSLPFVYMLIGFVFLVLGCVKVTKRNVRVKKEKPEHV